MEAISGKRTLPPAKDVRRRLRDPRSAPTGPPTKGRSKGKPPRGPQEPLRIGPYRLQKTLGKGGMGTVYRAFDERLERWVALKRIRQQVAASSRARARFQREARTAARLNHPGIVKVHDIFAAEGSDWIVMELVEGQSLEQILEDGPLASERALPLAIELISALAAAHAEGVVHRDLKAANVLVNNEGHTKILDFGLAKQVLYGNGDSSSISVAGQLVGTPHSMSPEQAMGLPVDLRSDLFSLGALLYQMLTGDCPFLGTNGLKTLKKVCTYRQPPACDLVSSVPREFSELLDRLLEKDPMHRPQQACEVVAALASLEDGARKQRSRGLAPTLPFDRGTAGHETRSKAPRQAVSSRRLKSARRLVTVMSCELVSTDDVSGSLDPEDLYEEMAEFENLAREAAESFAGHVANALGHRLVAYFGYPLERPDHLERAVDAALALVAGYESLGALSDTARNLAVRVGIHTGPAVVLGGSGRPEQLALGQTLDLAVDLQRVAAPNDILVSGGSCQQVASAHGASQPMSIELPGYPERVELFRISACELQTA